MIYRSGLLPQLFERIFEIGQPAFSQLWEPAFEFDTVF